MLAGVDKEVSELFARWCGWLQHERRYADHTLAAYHNDLRQFLSFLRTHTSELVTLHCLAELTARDFRGWLAVRQSEGYARSSTHRALAAVRSFFTYADRHKSFKNDAVFAIRAKKANRARPRPLAPTQLSQLLDEQAEGSDPHWVKMRDLALLQLLYGCGFRISEALALSDGSIEPKTTELRVLGKGQKERVVPLLDRVREAVLAYKALRPSALSSVGALFVGVRGKRLNASVAQARVRRSRELLGLPETCTPHALRHSFASDLLTSGVDIRSIQIMLGHSTLSTTQGYTEVEHSELAKSHGKSHPRG